MSVAALPEPLERRLRHAIKAHSEGSRDGVEAVYRAVLAHDPEHGVAKQMVGVLFHERGRPDEAIRWLGEAIAAQPNLADAHVNLGVALTQVGRLDEAIASYRRGLALGFDQLVGQFNLGVALMNAGRQAEAVDAFRKATPATGGRRQSSFVNLGSLLLQQGHPGEAEPALRVAVDLNPQDATAVALWADALERLGRGEAAEAAYRRALGLQPARTDVAHKLARFLMSEGRRDAARDVLVETLERQPGHVQTTLMLGQVLVDDGRREAAVTLLQGLLRLNPADADAHNGLGAALYAMGRSDAAERHFRRAIELAPALATPYYHLCLALEAQGRTADAYAAVQAALACDGRIAEAHAAAGRLLHRQGNYGAALAGCMQALVIDPRLVDAHLYVINLLRELGQGTAAVDAAQDLVALAPTLVNAKLSLALALESAGKFAEAEVALLEVLRQASPAAAYNSLGGIKKSQWRMQEAREAYRQAMGAEDANAALGSNYLLLLNYADDLPAEDVFAAHKDWAAKWERGIAPLPPRAPAADDDAPDRRLRIGYLSPDFRNHVVMHFAEPLLARHDRRRVEVSLYGETSNEDAVTARVRGYGHRYVRTVGLTDLQLAERIRDDRIDILIDLAGHTGGNRLPVLAHRPAPVQATYIGYPNTTGLSACDLRFVDAVTDPPGVADRLATERLVRLEGCFLCYRMPTDIPAVNDLPARRNGHVTFGSFNKLAKVAPAVLDAWADLLTRVPDSRLVVKGWSLADIAARDRLQDEFVCRGVAADRIVPRPFIQDDHYLTGFHEVDIALDTSPYSGTTTTFDALTMGVPVVTLRGDRHAARVGASIVTALGHPEWVGDDWGDYVRIAMGLAEDPRRLAELRAGLRERLARSSLTDAASFTDRFEGVLQDAWRNRIRLDGGLGSASLTEIAMPPDREVGSQAPAAIPGEIWYHAIPLPDGRTTPGWAPLLPDAFGLPARLDGIRMLDVEARDGYWSFEAVRRGASQVVALHPAADGGPADPWRAAAPENFAFAARLHNLDPEVCRALAPGTDLMSAEVAALGPYGLVLVQDFVPDWEEPMARMRRLATLCRGIVVLEAAVSDEVDDPESVPTLALVDGVALPNLAWLGIALERAGFAAVEGWLLHDSPAGPLARRAILTARADSSG